MTPPEPVVELPSYDPRQMTDANLGGCLRTCEPGSGTHRVLLAEQERRRAIRVRIAAHRDGAPARD